MMGTAGEMGDLCSFVTEHGIVPDVSRVYEGLESVPEAMRDLDAGRQFGKLAIGIG